MTRARRTDVLVLSLMAALLGACSAEYPEGRIACSSNADCPDDFICRPENSDSSERLCFRSGSVSTPSPSTDPEAGADSGPMTSPAAEAGSPGTTPRAGRDGGPDGRAGTTPDPAAGSGGRSGGGGPVAPVACSGRGCALRLVEQGITSNAPSATGSIRLVAQGFAPSTSCTGDICVDTTIR